MGVGFGWFCGRGAGGWVGVCVGWDLEWAGGRGLGAVASLVGGWVRGVSGCVGGMFGRLAVDAGWVWVCVCVGELGQRVDGGIRLWVHWRSCGPGVCCCWLVCGWSWWG